MQASAPHMPAEHPKAQLPRNPMLKPLDQILEPDSRYANVMAPDGRGGFRPMSLADHHDMVSGIQLSSKAPDEIRQMFDRALHAALYA